MRPIKQFGISIDVRSPFVVLVFSFAVLCLSVCAGAYHRRRSQQLEEGLREDLGVVLAAALTLLGLIIGFSFSMAINRYDQRKAYEEAEANALGTEYVRANLVSPADAARLRVLLTNYLRQRILFYTVRDAHQLVEINDTTTQLQSDLWSAVSIPAATHSSPVLALVLSGMNDVLNSQGYAQAAWWNRIPVAAWALMEAIAIGCHVLLGYASRRAEIRTKGLYVLPLLVSISFFLIADLDSPRAGVIRVTPENLVNLSSSLRVFSAFSAKNINAALAGADQAR
ncbi:MAG TPA: hypothetical protein VFA65_11725 [Bryobacteraceae bacterium]|nr:hypothetical protein [Bryobacteraceae bacterium]